MNWNELNQIVKDEIKSIKALTTNSMVITTANHIGNQIETLVEFCKATGIETYEEYLKIKEAANSENDSGN